MDRPRSTPRQDLAGGAPGQRLSSGMNPLMGAGGPGRGGLGAPPSRNPLVASQPAPGPLGARGGGLPGGRGALGGAPASRGGPLGANPLVSASRNPLARGPGAWGRAPPPPPSLGQEPAFLEDGDDPGPYGRRRGAFGSGLDWGAADSPPPGLGGLEAEGSLGGGLDGEDWIADDINDTVSAAARAGPPLPLPLLSPSLPLPLLSPPPLPPSPSFAFLPDASSPGCALPGPSSRVAPAEGAEGFRSRP